MPRKGPPTGPRRWRDEQVTRDAIVRPIVSEKSYAGIEHNTYTFLAIPRANKTEIKEAVQTIWDVRVLSVNTLKRRGKVKRRGYTAAPPTRSAPSSRSHRATVSRSSRVGVAVAVRKYKPTTLGAGSVSTFDEITRSTPEKALLAKGRKKAGTQRARPDHHPASGRRHEAAVPPHRLQAQQGRDPGQGRTIEYDPNRSSRIALLHYADGEKRYILAPDGVRVGDQLMSGEGAEIRPETPCRCGISPSGPWSTRSS